MEHHLLSKLKVLLTEKSKRKLNQSVYTLPVFMQLILKSELQIVAPNEVPSFCVEHMSSNIVIS